MSRIRCDNGDAVRVERLDDERHAERRAEMPELREALMHFGRALSCWLLLHRRAVWVTALLLGFTLGAQITGYPRWLSLRTYTEQGQ